MSRPEFRCTVKVQPIPEQSAENRHAYAYTVTIANVGDVTAQLIARVWTIIDGEGNQEQVRGLAVVGHQPVLKPGEQFEYTSWTHIPTPHGTMQGTYLCMTEDAQPFEAQVPAFMLGRPQALH